MEELDEREISEKNKKTLNMTEGSIVKILLLFSIPLILGNLLQQTYNTVDSIIVGNYVGSNALAAVGSSAIIINLLIGFSQGISVGAGVIISQAIGAKDNKRINLSVHTAIMIAILLGIILSIVEFIFTPQILKWMKTPEEIFKDSVVYLRLFSLGLVFSIVYNMEAGILNAVGNSKRSLLYLGVASVTNIFLDLLFVRGFNMGIKGVAIATNISQFISCMLALVFLLKIDDSYKVYLNKIKINKKIALNMIRVGFPTGIQSTVISFSNVLIQSSINVFGPSIIAGFGIYLKIDGFNVLPILSLSMASTTFTGQNYGARRKDRVKKGMWITLGMGIIYSIIIGILLLIFSRPLVELFTNDEKIIQAGISAMKYFCPFYFILSMLHSLAGTVRGVGKTMPPMLILLFSMCIFRIFWINFILPLDNTINNILILYPITWTIGLILMTLYTWRAKWI
ncbi:MAG: MATE family efflux transporter [Fusobacterium perfoetens]|uniref:MATE family efflux transporter n=1 Tax=Fusobacterium perfoetens TaxID=852 RepID=UPI002A75BC56|nr:MATE family efflux transporter [Fusobacterium perfoetens]MDY3237224.1 MATE family efflux transporter [Fusobacterium perfoetens]